MNCGPVSATTGRKSGFGSPWSAHPAGWLDAQSATVLPMPAANVGPRGQPTIGNARSVIPISEKHMRACSHRNAIVRWARRRVKRRTSSASTLPYANAVPISYARLSRSANTSAGTKGVFGCSLTTISVSLTSIVCVHQFRLGHYRRAYRQACRSRTGCVSLCCLFNNGPTPKLRRAQRQLHRALLRALHETTHEFSPRSQASLGAPCCAA